MEALDLLHQMSQEIPFILATSILDEDMTDAFMRKGAFDCIDKNRLNRLPLAVALAVEETLGVRSGITRRNSCGTRKPTIALWWKIPPMASATLTWTADFSM